MVVLFLAAYRKTHTGDEVVRRNVSESMPFPFNATALSIFNKKVSKEPLSDDERRFDEERAVWVQEFVDADKYVFANPMYNLFLPAEMKSYFDIVMAGARHIRVLGAGHSPRPAAWQEGVASAGQRWKLP